MSHSCSVGDRHESLIDRANEGERSIRNRQAVSLKTETRLARIKKENSLRIRRSKVDLLYDQSLSTAHGIFFGWGAMALAGSISGCVEAVPQDVVEAVDHIDRDLVELRAGEFLPTDYTQFSHQWMALKARAQADEDLIRWPWEPNELEVALRQLQAEGSRIVARLTKERESLRRSAEDKIAQVENRFQIDDVCKSVPLIVVSLSGQKPDEIERLMKQARALYEQGQYDQSLNASDRAAQSLFMHSAVLRSELRYTHRWKLNQRLAIDDHKRPHLLARLVQFSTKYTSQKDRPFVLAELCESYR